MGGLIRALLHGVYMRAPEFVETPKWRLFGHALSDVRSPKEVLKNLGIMCSVRDSKQRQLSNFLLPSFSAKLQVLGIFCLLGLRISELRGSAIEAASGSLQKSAA